MSAPIRVLIVDDSPSMRAILTRILSADREIEVVGLAPEPHSAREMIRELDPDVMTLDIEMPGMDGLSFLERVMRLRPMPVVMCSTLTARGAEATIEALRLGAVDYIAKPSGQAEDMAREADRLRDKVKAAARSRVRPVGQPARVTHGRGSFAPDRLIAVGASTGGVEALFGLVGALPADCPPVLIVQHMPAAFTASFAARLDGSSAVRVVEAEDGQPVEPGCVYVAPGGARHMELGPGRLGEGGGPRIRLRAGPLVTGHRPAADVLFRSLAMRGPSAVGVILTGMGADGAEGLLAMRRAGAPTFGQSEESCVIYGMPRVAFEIGAVERQLPLSALPEAILAACRETRLESA